MVLIELTAIMAYTRAKELDKIRIFYSKSLNEKIIDKQCNYQKLEIGKWTLESLKSCYK